MAQKTKLRISAISRERDRVANAFFSLPFECLDTSACHHSSVSDYIFPHLGLLVRFGFASFAVVVVVSLFTVLLLNFAIRIMFHRASDAEYEINRHDVSLVILSLIRR